LTFSLCEFLLSGARENQLPDALVKAKDYVNQNFQKLLSIPEIAAAAGVSLNNLTHLFHTYENTTPRAFLEQRRLERACFLLSTTDQSISEVATASGFSNSNYFAKVFRRITGTSPGRYREKVS
jgi:transcriptional regulator GlxA family with amidase domain